VERNIIIPFLALVDFIYQKDMQTKLGSHIVRNHVCGFNRSIRSESEKTRILPINLEVLASEVGEENVATPNLTSTRHAVWSSCNSEVQDVQDALIHCRITPVSHMKELHTLLFAKNYFD
jgi:hypothetical protein